jgi:hypothetical protein
MFKNLAKGMKEHLGLDPHLAPSSILRFSQTRYVSHRATTTNEPYIVCVVTVTSQDGLH